LVASAVLITAGIVYGRRRGYPMGGWVMVRCREGHLFSTIWVPFASVKAIRMGWRRFQHCPVGHHWTFVRPVRAEDLTEADRELASRTRDVAIP
jgi:hypothetical protein